VTVEIGTELAGYRIVGLIGRGGMGVVYRAQELALDRLVALKLIAPELADDASFRERFLRESRLAASLDHPSILPVYAAGEADGELFLATRYVDGTDLGTLLEREGPLSAARGLVLVGQVADALDTAHRLGLVHRDVKPRNILVGGADHCYLCDFGLATLVADGATTTRGLLGSLDYLAPEQIRRGEVDGRTDEYALACVLYECLAGVPPFRRETEAQTLWAHMHEDPEPLADHPGLGRVFARALAKERTQRYESCTAFVDDARSAGGIAPRRRKSILLAAIGVAVLVGAALAFAVVQLTGGGEGAQTVSLSRDSIVAFDPSTNEVVAQVPVAGSPTALAVGDGFVWAINTDDRTLTQIDAGAKRVVRTLGLDGIPFFVAAGGGAAWVITYEPASDESGVGIHSSGTLLRVDASSRQIERTLTRRDPPLGGVAFGERSVWVGHTRPLRIDPQTTAVIARIDAAALVGAVGEGSVWGIYPERSLTRVIDVDPGTNSVRASIPVSVDVDNPFLALLAAGEGWVWVGATESRSIYRIDPDRDSVESAFSVGAKPSGIAAGLGSVWVTSGVAGTLMRVDPGSEEIVAQVDLGRTPTDVAVGEGLVWVAVK
jgi:protein kinase-like protein